MTNTPPRLWNEQKFDEKFDHFNSQEKGGRICDGICDKEYTLEDIKSFFDSEVERLVANAYKLGYNEASKIAEAEQRGRNEAVDYIEKNSEVLSKERFVLGEYIEYKVSNEVLDSARLKYVNFT